MTDTISMARGRDVIVPTSKNARSGRGGLGSHQKIIEKNSSFVDPSTCNFSFFVSVLHPTASPAFFCNTESFDFLALYLRPRGTRSYFYQSRDIANSLLTFNLYLEFRVTSTYR